MPARDPVLSPRSLRKSSPVLQRTTSMTAAVSLSPSQPTQGRGPGSNFYLPETSVVYDGDSEGDEPATSDIRRNHDPIVPSSPFPSTSSSPYHHISSPKRPCVFFPWDLIPLFTYYSSHCDAHGQDIPATRLDLNVPQRNERFCHLRHRGGYSLAHRVPRRYALPTVTFIGLLATTSHG